MAEFGDKKFADAIPHLVHATLADPTRGLSGPDNETTAEQSREVQESREALDAEASIRAKMVDISRGNQQAGRQGS